MGSTPSPGRVLALTSRPLESRSSGYDIRVLNLCANTTGEVHLFVVPLLAQVGPREPATLSRDGVFASTTQTGPPPGSSPWRLLRATDDHYLQRSAPEWFEQTRRRLEELVRTHDIDVVAAFGADVAELAHGLPGCDVVVDVCDSASRIWRRRLEAQPPVGGRARARSALDLRRLEATEGGLPARFRLVTTISEPDSDRVRQLAGGAGNVVTVPNGVDDALLRPLPEPSTSRSVAFWGQLDFEPNQDAMRFFLDEVFRPHLRPAGVSLVLVGPDAPPWLVEEARDDEQVVLRGFVPDLREALVDHPVMVNPMRLGSGLKNKVLEAFGLGLVVVSTRRGVEAMPGVRDGVHAVLAESPEELATRTLALLDDADLRLRLRTSARELLEEHYRWDRVGARWSELLAGGPAQG